jgi:2,3-bisphosphoglycerate-independent phosphoglycerate mutase
MAPNESFHSGSIENKVHAIEDFDARIVAPISDGIKKLGDYRIFSTPDYPRPIRFMTPARGCRLRRGVRRQDRAVLGG